MAKTVLPFPDKENAIYEVVKTLGHGDTGALYEVYHRRLKVLRTLEVVQGRDEQALRRFERGAAAAAQLEHPNLMRIYDYFEQKGYGYLIMERVMGEPLEDRMKRLGGSLPSGEVLTLMRDACRGLWQLHRIGAVHRGISPRSLVLSVGHEGRGLLKISGFGIVRAADGPENRMDSAAGRFTPEGVWIGVPGFAAPEQTAGQRVSPAADIYALAAVGFEGLTGAPWRSAEPQLRHNRGSAGEVNLTGIRGLAPDVARLLGRCLAPDPDRRPEDAMALEGELLRLDSHVPDFLTAPPLDQL